jgi:uncharacterized protein (TIGR03118 family)
MSALAACSGGGGGTPVQVTPPPPPTAYVETKLVSDTPGNPHQDSNLVDGWGIAFGTGAVWVANNGTNTSTLYDGNGVPQSLVVAIPPGTATTNISGGTANPTGTVFNSTTGFTVSQGGKTGAASFIFVGEEGTISGWSPGVNLTNAVTVVDNSTNGAVYKGLALYTPTGGTSLLYVANFHAGSVDVFDSTYKPTTVPGGFKDPTLPAGYAPFGIQTIGTDVFVAYAQQDTKDAPAAFNENDGPGLGFVDEFDTNGNFIKRFDNVGGHLNAPWGIAMAPSNFGSYGNDLLVGNFGDGTISVYDPTSGNYLGKLINGSGAVITIPGLWGIAFGNGADSQPTNTLFFASGPAAESHGLYGRIDLPGTYTAPGATSPSY